MCWETLQSQQTWMITPSSLERTLGPNSETFFPNHVARTSSRLWGVRGGVQDAPRILDLTPIHNTPLLAPSSFLHPGSLPQLSSCLLGTSQLLFKCKSQCHYRVLQVNTCPLHRLVEMTIPHVPCVRALNHSPGELAWHEVYRGAPSHRHLPHQSPILPLAAMWLWASNLTSLILPCSIFKMGLIMFLSHKGSTRLD